MIKVPDGTLRILVQGLQRVRLAERVSDDPYLVGEFEALPDVLERDARGRGADAERPGALRAHHRARAVPARGAAARGGERRRPERARAPRRLDAAHDQDRGAPGDPRDGRRRAAPAPDLGDPQPRARGVRARLEDPVAGAVGDGEGPARVLPPPAAEGDPAGARRGRPRAGRGRRAARAARRARRCPRRCARRPSASWRGSSSLPPAAAEYGVIRTYLEWILTLPWGTYTEDNLDLDHARKVLDDDHFDLEKVKDRIIEYLAVAKLRNEVSGQILCFVGPPGVGKTSLGHSIARALGRKFVRMSVGGVRDESEIRGHRRTYIGAMPGTIIRSLRDAESANPLLLIDEIDKMGADWRGDPVDARCSRCSTRSRTATFRDHYLDLPFDLSKVLFICTANTLDTIPGPLLDRMDVIQLSGYTEDEKLGIAKRYLLPKQLEAHGLKRSQLDALGHDAAHDHPRVHARGRRAQPRAADRRRLPQGGDAGREGQGAEDARRRRASCASGSGRGASRARCASARPTPGVATGLAYTAAGGDVLFIEATAYPGKGSLHDHRPARRGDAGVGAGGALVGALARGRARRRRTTGSTKHDVHIHVPAGAVPKDGPSAGVTMATAIASLVRGEPVADDVGMTGEITLTGQVLPIGGIREKSLAAQRAGLKRVIFPRENEPDLDDLPPETREALSSSRPTRSRTSSPRRSTATARARSQRGPSRGRAAGRRLRARRARSAEREALEQLRGTARRPRFARRRHSSWCSCRPRSTNVISCACRRRLITYERDLAAVDPDRPRLVTRPSSCDAMRAITASSSRDAARKRPRSYGRTSLNVRTSTRSTAPDVAADRSLCARVTSQPSGASNRNPVPCTVWVDGSLVPPPRSLRGSRAEDRDEERAGRFGTPAQGKGTTSMDTRDKVYGAADNIKPYVERAMSDEKLRSDVMQCVQDGERALPRADERPERAGARSPPASRPTTTSATSCATRSRICAARATACKGKPDHSAATRRCCSPASRSASSTTRSPGPRRAGSSRTCSAGGGDRARHERPQRTAGSNERTQRTEARQGRRLRARLERPAQRRRVEAVGGRDVGDREQDRARLRRGVAARHARRPARRRPGTAAAAAAATRRGTASGRRRRRSRGRAARRDAPRSGGASACPRRRRCAP